MLTAEAAGLALTVANGLVRISRRVDLVLSEREATEGPMALPVPDVNLGPSSRQMYTGLRQLLDQPVKEGNDPIAADRAAIEELLANNPNPAHMDPFVKKYLPELATREILDLNGSFMRGLRQARPDWADDPELTMAGFYVSSGPDFRNKSYTWRLALTVVDVLAELGAENTALFLRDKSLQGIVGAILRRFAEADAQTTDSSRDLVRAVLKATVNGALDAKDKLDIDHVWVDSLLDAVASARAQAADQDNFIMGLFEGKGYPLLVGAVMETAGGRLSADEATGFNRAASTLLKNVATVVEQEPQFRGFFNDHWGDLLRAGLKSVEKNGPGLLADDDPLLGRILSAVAVDLARRPDNKFLTRGSLVDLVDAVVTTVASNPEMVDDLLSEDWLGALVKSVAGTMSNDGIRRSFTRETIEKMIKEVLRALGDQPQLIIDDPGLAQALLGDVLRAVSAVDLLKAEPLASATVTVASEAISKHPELLKYDFTRLIAVLAGKVAELVKARKLTGVQGQHLMKAVVGPMADNPRWLLDSRNRLIETVLDVVMNVPGEAGDGLIAGTMQADVVNQVLGAIAVAAGAVLANHTIEEFSDKLAELLRAGLIRAEAELGVRLSLPTLPNLLGQLVLAWAQGEIGTVDPDDESFRRQFADLAKRVSCKVPPKG